MLTQPPPPQPVLSSPLSALRPRYDVVVVGSGYGGGVAASRLARAGRSVCVLERGKEYLPGEFPRNEAEARAETQVRVAAMGGKRMGSALALFDFHVDEEVTVLRGSGLGGTSLINSAVAVEPDAELFEDPAWPAALRDDLASLREGFTRAREVLEPRTYPQGWPALPKQEALRRSAEAMGERWTPVPLNITFEDRVNAAGVRRPVCNLCGDCVTGCNTGAKNTVATTYLPDAWNHGADIFTEVSVSHVTPRADGGWTVVCEPVDVGREAFPGAAPMVVHADVVVLAAGTLGSTRILLRSRERGLPTSARLGAGFSGNGDAIGFAYDNDVEIRGLGAGERPVDPKAAPGPNITSMVDGRRRSRPLGERYVLQEGTLPGAIAAIYPTSFPAAAARWGVDTRKTAGTGRRRSRARLRELARGAALARTQTLLAVGHDSAAGRLDLDAAGELRVRWPGAAREAATVAKNERMVEATAATGGVFVPNPQWANGVKPGVISVHPLGGCAMAEDAERGVTDHAGRVFAGPTGTAVHEGLLVADAAVMPRSLGVNPLLTITALAERAMKLLARARGWTIDYARTRPRVRPRHRLGARAVGLSFTERMAGHLTLVADGAAALDHRAAARTGAALDQPVSFVLTLHTDDLDGTLADPSRPLGIFGTVHAPGLAPEPLQVSEGRFHLLVDDPARIDAARMIYSLRLHAPDGRSWRFRGEKAVHGAGVAELWDDTTTLAVDVTDDDGALVARGQMRIAMTDFARQLGTIKATGARSSAAALRAQARFGRFFFGRLFDTYGERLAPPAVHVPKAPARDRRPLRADAPEVHYLRTSDGAPLVLTRYRGGRKGPVLLAHGLGVSSRIFSLDTVEENLVEHLVAAGYDTWLLDYRASIDLGGADRAHDADVIATIDLPEAVDAVRRLTRADSVQVVAHCFGATVFYMAMLSGRLQGVRAAVTSQATPHLVGAPLVRLKSGLHLPGVLGSLGVRAMDAHARADRGALGRLYDRALSAYPVSHDERCRSATCRRITFLYAELFEHAQLNRATHDTLHELFGVANVPAFRHLGKLVRGGRLVDARGADVYMPHAERLAIAIRMIHGARNACFDPVGSAETLAWLRRHNDPALYSRVVIPDYGHIDCILGANAARDVYPHVLAHLEATR